MTMTSKRPQADINDHRQTNFITPSSIETKKEVRAYAGAIVCAMPNKSTRSLRSSGGLHNKHLKICRRQEGDAMLNFSSTVASDDNMTK